jgi:hypothetical protein
LATVATGSPSALIEVTGLTASVLLHPCFILRWKNNLPMNQSLFGQNYFLLAVVMTAVAGGCGEKMPRIVPVEVTVIYQGKPLDQAQVMFTPERGRPAYGRTNAEGKCQLTTIDPDDGAYVGEHKVAIAKQVEVPPNQRHPDYQPGGRFSRYPEMREVIPTKYASSKSTLKAKVEEDGDNKFSFELTD